MESSLEFPISFSIYLRVVVTGKNKLSIRFLCKSIDRMQFVVNSDHKMVIWSNLD